MKTATPNTIKVKLEYKLVQIVWYKHQEKYLVQLFHSLDT